MSTLLYCAKRTMGPGLSRGQNSPLGFIATASLLASAKGQLVGRVGPVRIGYPNSVKLKVKGAGRMYPV